LKEKILEAEKTFKFVKPAVMNEEKLTFRIPKRKATEHFWKAFSVLIDELDAKAIKDFSFSEKQLAEDVESSARVTEALMRKNNSEVAINV